MPRKRPTAKFVLWDDLHVSLYGPPDAQNYRITRKRVDALMKRFGKVIRVCMRGHARDCSDLERFRVRVQS